jgi:hypothetical protein
MEDDKKWDEDADDAMEILRKKAVQIEKITGRMVKVLDVGMQGAAPVFLSSHAAAAKVETFKPTGTSKVRALVNVSNDIPYFFSEDEEQKRFGGTIKKFRVSIQDVPDADLIGSLPEVTDFIQNARKDGLPVLVHCAMGVSRSASVVIAYMIRYENMTLAEAHALLKSKRNEICPNLGFLQQLGMWEEQCRGASTLNDLPQMKTIAEGADFAREDESIPPEVLQESLKSSNAQKASTTNKCKVS